MVTGRLRRGKRQLEALAGIPAVYGAGKGMLLGGGALVLSAIEVGSSPVPVAASLAAVCSGWQAVAAAAGAVAGYVLLGKGKQALVWTALCWMLGTALRLGEKLSWLPLETGLLMIPAVTGTVMGSPWQEWGVQAVFGALGGGICYVSMQGACIPALWGLAALLVRGLVGLGGMPLACLVAGMAAGSAPGAVLLGLALEWGGLAGMTAGMGIAGLVRACPLPEKYRCLAAAPVGCLAGMALGRSWNIGAWLGVSMGGVLGWLLPLPRAPGGIPREQLEKAARALEGMQRALAALPPPVCDTTAPVEKLRREACFSCPQADGCREKEGLDTGIFSDPLGFACARTGRLLRQARQVREQMRLVEMQHRLLGEYRRAVAQQYGMLAGFLQRLAQGLPVGSRFAPVRYRVLVSVRSRQAKSRDGDQCAAFPGVGSRFYVVLCDGMGTGREAALEAETAVGLLRQLLTAGLPPRYAMESLNAQLVLTGRSGVVTADLAEICLDSGRVVLYKWGAAGSYLLCRGKSRRLGGGTPPPGLEVSGSGQRIARLTMRRGETLVMASDGVALPEALVPPKEPLSPGNLAQQLLSRYALQEDDATLAVIRLEERNKHPPKSAD